MTKISDLSALTGAGVDAANDLVTVVDMSDAGAARNKKMTFAELKLAIAAYSPGGTDVSLADGGTGASLVDPNADRVLFWDDSAGAVTWLTMGTNLTITGTTLDASGASSALTVSTQSGTSYTAVLGDANTYVRFTSASAVAFTIPPNSSVAFPTGTRIRGIAAGAGTVTLTAGAGVTLNSRGALLASAGQYAIFELIKVATDTWDVAGDVA